jgi:hypothetical protein
VTVYDKAKADGIALEKLGTERLWLALKPIWPDDRPHLTVSEVAEWFASYVYLPKLRDGVVLQAAIRESIQPDSTVPSKSTWCGRSRPSMQSSMR